MSQRELVQVAVDKGVAEITISRPKALNALNGQVLDELEQALAEVAANDAVACLIITGEGDRAFVAGADIGEMKDMSPRQALEFSRAGHRVLGAIESFPVPVIAAVNGFALGGGCEVALACDIVYASERAKFGQPEVKLGLMPGFGGTVRLPRKMGLAAASEWIYIGEIHTAQEAKQLGLVHDVLPHDELLLRVRKVAKVIALRAPMAVRAAKQAMVQGLALDPARAINLEQQTFSKLFDTEDSREGMQAFLDKREPSFKGK
ncbi:MAG: enoyl-CoA hydratase-related protein [Myxococcota bacterium]